MSTSHLLEGLRRRVLVVVLAALAVLAGVSGVARAEGGGAGPGDPSPQGAAARVAATENQDALAYWTPARMKSARPAQAGLNGLSGPGGPPPDRGRPESVAPAAATVQQESASTATSSTTAASEGYWQYSNTANPNRQIGRLFYQAYDPGSGTWYPSWCSGTVVNSENKSVVWTAGHCVFQTFSNRWNRNYVFCPGYRNGSCSLGRWTPYYQMTTTQWQNAQCQYTDQIRCSSQEFRYDFGALKMNALNGYRIVDAVGGHGLQFNGAVQQTQYLFGYPKNRSNGEYLYFCFGGNGYDSYWNLSMTCTAGPGASGGPWLTQINSSWLGWVRSVNSNGGTGALVGPYQGSVAQNLFAAVRY